MPRSRPREKCGGGDNANSSSSSSSIIIENRLKFSGKCNHSLLAHWRVAANQPTSQPSSQLVNCKKYLLTTLPATAFVLPFHSIHSILLSFSASSLLNFLV